MTALVCEYRCDSGPLMVADVTAAPFWKGGDDDGKGVVVEYMARDMLELPKQLLQSKKQGLHQKKFATLAEARAFESELLAAMGKLHPKARALPRYPDQPGWSMRYIGDERVCSVEEVRESAYSRMCKKHPGGATVQLLDKKSQARAVLMDQEAGVGLVLADRERGALVVARPHVDDGYEALKAKRVSAAAKLKAPKGKEQLPLDGRVLLFHAAISWSELSRLELSPGPLKLEGGAAYVELPAGQYAVAYHHDVDLAGAGATVLWLTRQK